MHKESIESVQKLNRMYCCHWGLERSRAIQRAYESQGIIVDVFPGGTQQLIKMNKEQIKKTIGGKQLFIIFDNGQREVADFEKAREVLDKSKISYTTINTDRLKMECNDLGVRYEDFKI